MRILLRELFVLPGGGRLNGNPSIFGGLLGEGEFVY